MPQRLCADEQIVPFKGAYSLKQYLPSKPHKYGYKVLTLCGADATIHDFMIYSGPIQPVDGGSDISAKSNVVMHLVKHISEQKITCSILTIGSPHSH